MKLNELKLLGVAAMSVFAFACGPVSAVENGEEGDAKSEAPVKKKKKGPTKKPEYFRWKDAAAVAEAWEQPVLVFIDLEDSKICSRVRAATVGNRLFKDFVRENCVYYRYKIPRVEQKRGRRNRGPVKKSDDIPKPDFEAVKESEKRIVDAVLDGKKNNFPGVALFKASGQMLGLVGFDSTEPSLEAFVNELKGEFEKGKYDFTMPKTVQKFLDAETKKRAALEKRMKK